MLLIQPLKVAAYSIRVSAPRSLVYVCSLRGLHIVCCDQPQMHVFLILTWLSSMYITLIVLMIHSTY